MSKRNFMFVEEDYFLNICVAVRPIENDCKLKGFLSPMKQYKIDTKSVLYFATLFLPLRTSASYITILFLSLFLFNK